MSDTKEINMGGNCKSKWIYLNRKTTCFTCGNNTKRLRFVHDTWDTSKSDIFEYYCPFDDCSGGGSYRWSCFKCKTNYSVEEDELYEE